MHDCRRPAYIVDGRGPACLDPAYTMCLIGSVYPPSHLSGRLFNEYKLGTGHAKSIELGVHMRIRREALQGYGPHPAVNASFHHLGFHAGLLQPLPFKSVRDILFARLRTVLRPLDASVGVGFLRVSHRKRFEGGGLARLIPQRHQALNFPDHSSRFHALRGVEKQVENGRRRAAKNRSSVAHQSHRPIAALSLVHFSSDP